jgi:formate-nitrite transporter family protein
MLARGIPAAATPEQPAMNDQASRSRPFKPHERIFEQEVQEAKEDLGRPAHAQLISGFMAGVGVGFSVLLISTILALSPDDFPELYTRLLLANAYAAGFVLVIMGRADLFTEYTTIALLPVLTGDAAIGALMRFWGIVYTANLIGGGLLAVGLAGIGPELGILAPDALGDLARRLTDHHWWVICLSATFAGWLMGLLSWLVVAGRESISQILFIWLIAGIIGFSHLHHSITGAVEVFTATLTSQVAPEQLLHFLLWTTVGNIVGGVLFAVLIRYSVLRA